MLVGHILTPFVAAVITAYLFNPLIGWLNRRVNIGRALWIGILYVLVGTITYFLLRMLGPLVMHQYYGLINQIPNMSNQVEEWIVKNQHFHIGGISFDLYTFEKPITDFLNEITQNLQGVVLKVPDLVVSVLERVVLFVTYLIVTFYLLLQADQLTAWMYDLVPAPYREEIKGLGKQVDMILAGYIRGTLLLIPIMSVLTYIALTILDVRYALMIAIASGVLEVIPLIGPWSAAGIAMTVALFQSTAPFGWPNWVLALVVGATYFVLRMSEDNFIIPQVVGHAVHLHPVLVLFAILAGGAVGGPFGLLVAIPVAAVARLLLRYIYRKLIDVQELPPPDVQPPAATIRAKREATEPIPARPARSGEEPVHAD